MASSAETDASAHFVAKWQQREPEMQFAEIFCADAQRPRFRAWGALLHELRETLFELSDARVSGVKIGWWAEEMMGLEQGRQRHPLSRELLGIPAPWSVLGRALIDHAAQDARAADAHQAIAMLTPLAAAVIAVESAVFEADASASASTSLASHWLLHRLPRGLSADDQAMIPMNLLARHGLTAAQLAAGGGQELLADWARELLHSRPAAIPGAAFLRRSRHRFDSARLDRLALGKGFAEPAPPLTLWRAWRSAVR